jgi:hypothetical protein
MIKSIRMRWAGLAERIEDRTHTGFWRGNLMEKRPLRRPSGRCEGMIKINLQELGWGGIDWIDLAQNKDGWRELVNAAMNFGFRTILGIC